ncbi:hypothetical protein JCM5353_009059, partial [Sporobolomyces roseus]
MEESHHGTLSLVAQKVPALVTFAHCQRLLELPGTALLSSDVHNADKQDDAAARRLYSAQTLKSTTVEGKGTEIQPDFDAFVALSFIIGELTDAWLNRDLTHPRRVLIAARAYFFLLYWKNDIIVAGGELKSDHNLTEPFLNLNRNFLASQTFETLLT